MLKLKHLRHPLRTATVTSALVRTPLHIRSSAERSQQYYRGDSRYALDNVDRGFISLSRIRDPEIARMTQLCCNESAPHTTKPWSNRTFNRRPTKPLHGGKRCVQEIWDRSCMPCGRAISTLRGIYRNCCVTQAPRAWWICHTAWPKHIWEKDQRSEPPLLSWRCASSNRLLDRTNRQLLCTGRPRRARYRQSIRRRNRWNTGTSRLSVPTLLRAAHQKPAPGSIARRCGNWRRLWRYGLYLLPGPS